MPVDVERKHTTLKMDTALYEKFATRAIAKFGRTTRHPGAITRGVEEALKQWLERNP